MKRFSTDNIRELFARRPVGPVPDAGAFWSDFRARARLRNQEQPDKESVHIFTRGWAVAAACTALLVVCGGLLLFQLGSAPEPDGKMTLDVKAAHSAVLMIEDEADQSTIVWIVDMQT